MLTPVLKFSEIKKNPSIMVGLEQAAIVRYGDVMAYVVSPERMEELLAAEEQYENGYMAQKDIALKTNLDCGMPITDREMVVNYLARNIKVGDTVRIKSLDNTYKSYGYGDDMKEVSELAIVEEVDGCQVWFKLDVYSYHIDDLELVK